MSFTYNKALGRCPLHQNEVQDWLCLTPALIPIKPMAKDFNLDLKNTYRHSMRLILFLGRVPSQSTLQIMYLLLTCFSWEGTPFGL